ncbi:hypothetical protein QYM36_019045 [Artemia franciscana]|uniref:Gag protein n=1 Tax=Artemia franciscana TaxID=6661 RepID=A0AA88KZT9_ARTSF|nr:hypothetical protein QYM36_019045 [Artemia franciscana]
MSTGNSSNPTNIPDNSQLAYQQVPSQITHQRVVDPFSHIQTLTKPSEVKTWIRQLKSVKATLKWDDDYTLVMASNTCRGIFQRHVDEIIELGNTFTLDDLCEKLLRNVGARKTPRQCLQAIVEMKQKPEEAVFEFYMRLKTGKIDYCKAEGLDNSKSIDAFALVDSIVLQAFETGLRSELQEAVRLRQDDYDNLDEALEIAQTIESVKSSLRSNSQMDQFKYLTAGVAEINISRTRTPHGQAGRAARGNYFSNQYNSYQQGPRQMTRHPNTGNTFFNLDIIKGYRDRIYKVLGGIMKEIPEIVIIIRALEVILIKEGKLNPVDVLSRPPDDTLLQTRPFSLADEEAEFFLAVTVQTESTTMNSTSPKRKFGLSRFGSSTD